MSLYLYGCFNDKEIFMFIAFKNKDRNISSNKDRILCFTSPFSINYIGGNGIPTDWNNFTILIDIDFVENCEMDPDFHVSSSRFSYCFQNFSQITKLTYSPACWIQNLPWKIFIEPVVQSGKKYLSVYVGCTQSGIEHWTCRAIVEIYKLFGLTPKIIRANTGLIFDSAASTSWGHIQFIQWDVVANPVNGFIKDGAITVEVTITAEIPVGLTLTPDHFTDERANILYPQWISEKIILEEKIQNLSNHNEEKDDKIRSHQQLIENLETELEKRKEVNNQLNEYKKNFETEHSTLEQLQLKNELCENNLKKEKENTTKLNQEISDSKTEIKDLQEKIASSSKQLEHYKKIIQSSNTNNLCDQTLQLTESENVDLKRKLTLLETELKDKLKKQTANYENQIKNIEIERDTLKNNLETISRDCNLVREELKSMQKTTSEEKAAMKKKEEEMSKTIEELKDQMKNLNETNKDLNTRKAELETGVTTLQLQLKKTYETGEKIQEKQKTVEVERDALKKSLETISKECSLAKEELKSLKNTYSEAEAAMKKNEDELNKTIQDLKDKIKTLEVTNQDLNTEKDKLEDQVAALQLQLKKISETQEILQGKQKSIEEERDTLKNNLETISKDYSLAKEELNSFKKSNSEVQDALKNNEDELNKSIQDFKDKIKTLEIANQDLNTEKDRLENQVAALQLQLKKISETEEILQEKQKSIEEERDTLKHNLETISKDCSLAKEELNSLKKANSEVQVALKRNDDELNKTILDLRDKIKTFEMENQDLNTEKDKLEDQVASLQLQLNKISETEGILQEKQKSIEKERDTLKNNLETISKDCSSAKEELNSLKKNSTEEQVALKKKEDELDKTIQDLKDKMKTLDISNQNLKTEKNKLENQVATLQLQLKKTSEREKIVQEKQQNVEIERNALKKRLETMSRDCGLAGEQLNSLKTTNSELQVSLKKNEIELNKAIQDLKDQMKDLTMTNQKLKTEKEKLEQQIATLQSQLKKNYETEEVVRGKQNIIDNLKTENQNLIAQMKVGYEQYNKLKNMKDNIEAQLKIVMDNYSQVNEEANSLRKTIASTQKDLSDCKQKMEQLQTQNNDLNAKVRSLVTQLEEIKNKLTHSRNDSTDITDLTNYCEKLKSEITSLMGSLSDSINEIQRMKNKFKRRTTGEEPPNFQIDLNNKNVTEQEENSINSTSNNKIEAIERKYKIAIDAKNKLRCEMEALRKKYERINRDTHEAFAERNRNVTKELSDLQFRLEEERIEKLRILYRKKDVDDELKELKQENEEQIKTKNTLLFQLRECHKLSKDVFWIIIELVKIKKGQNTLPCSIEARLGNIMELLSVNKRRTTFRLTTRDTELNQPASIQISTDVIQKKLEDLEDRLEKEIEIVSSELKAEKTRRMKLILSNEKLTQLLEHEMIMKDQFKKLERVNELRSQELEDRMSGPYSQCVLEKSKRFQYEDDFHSLSNKITIIEQQTDFLKKNMWRQAVEFNECSCTSTEDLSFNNIQRNIKISSDSIDEVTGIAGCEPPTSTDENPVQIPSTQYTTEPNNVAVKQDQQKNAGVVGNIEGARIIESNPISASNTN